jgi:ClpX C4-type zinc finger
VNPRELLQSAQAAEREGDLARAGALLEQAARIYESTGHDARAAQMRRHVERLGPLARAAARGVEEPPGSPVEERREAVDPEPLPGVDRPLFERTPTLADPALEAWCSFCCRPSREVGALVAGPSQAYVCRGCVALAASLLDGAAASSERAGEHGELTAVGDPPPTAGDVEIGLPTTRRLRACDSARGAPSQVPDRTESPRALPETGTEPTGAAMPRLWASESARGTPFHVPNRSASPGVLPGIEGDPPGREPFPTSRVGQSEPPRARHSRTDVQPEPLPTQAEAVARIEAALVAGHARVLLVGAAGSGKSTWLHAWALRGLGTAWDGAAPLPEHGALLVDDVDRLEAAARRQLARALRSRPVVLALDATVPEPEHQVGGRRVHAPEQVETLAGSWLPGPVLDGLTLECFRAPGDEELRMLAERWRAPDGSPAQPDALEEALRLAVRSARAAHALHALLLRWWASR